MKTLFPLEVDLHPPKNNNMGIGKHLRDELGFGSYVRRKILRALSPGFDPIPFRGWVDDSEDDLPFFAELESSMRDRPGSAWNILGPPGFGKTCLARWAAVRWGQRFLDNPDQEPIPLWGHISPSKSFHLQANLFRCQAAQEHMGLHPFICIVDEGARQAAQAFPVLDIKQSGILFVGSRKAVEGHVVRLAPWEIDWAFLAAKRRLGDEGVERIAAVRSSPAAELLGFPLFVGKLLELPALPRDKLERRGGVEDVLGKLHQERCGGPADFTSWCEAILREQGEDLGLVRDAARVLQLPWSRIFRAYLLRVLIVANRAASFLKSTILEKDELSLLSRIVEKGEVAGRFKDPCRALPIETTNSANLRWYLLRMPVPQGVLQCCRAKVSIPGHEFPQGMSRLRLSHSDLSGIRVAEKRVEDCWFTDTSLEQASFENAVVVRSAFSRCALRFANFTACTFEDCKLADVLVAEAGLCGSRFLRCVLSRVGFGPGESGTELDFEGCSLRGCTFVDLGEGCCRWLQCSLYRLNLSGRNLRGLETRATVFSKCDLSGISAPGVNLALTRFNECLLSDADLHGADLRGATFRAVDFQPGPSSRCGHTELSSRDHPMYGSQSGYYSTDLREGVYGDPDLLRTADLHDSDLRNARFENTDLFRVDLRGAHLDPQVRSLAIQMHAFVD